MQISKTITPISKLLFLPLLLINLTSCVDSTKISQLEKDVEILKTQVAGNTVTSVSISGGGNSESEASTTKKVYAKTDFKKLIDGKSKEEVIKLLGKPESVISSGDTENYFYKNIVKDDASDVVISSIMISFESGKGAKVY